MRVALAIDALAVSISAASTSRSSLSATICSSSRRMRPLLDRHNWVEFRLSRVAAAALYLRAPRAYCRPFMAGVSSRRFHFMGPPGPLCLRLLPQQAVKFVIELDEGRPLGRPKC